MKIKNNWRRWNLDINNKSKVNIFPKFQDLFLNQEQFLKKAFTYYADKHHKENTEVEKAWVAVYGDDEWAVCRKYLQATSMVIAAGFVKKSIDSKFLSISSKIPHKYAKILGFGGMFLQIVKEDYKDLITTDLLQCIAVINSKSLTDINDYTTEMIGTTSDDFIFE